MGTGGTERHRYSSKSFRINLKYESDSIKNQKTKTVKAVRMRELEKGDSDFVYRYQCPGCGKMMTFYTDEKPRGLPKCFDCQTPLK